MKRSYEFQIRTSIKSGRETSPPVRSTRNPFKLPDPVPPYKKDLFEVIASRRSRRSFSGSTSVENLSLIMWAANGITLRKRFISLRAAPSAGALYSVENYVAVHKVEGLEEGFYRYEPEDHSLVPVFDADLSAALKRACLDQHFVAEAAFNIVWTAVVDRFIYHYGERGWRYVYMDVGHIAENAFLAAEALGLGACPVGAFFDDELTKLLDLPEGEFPIYILSVGVRRGQ